MSESSVKQQIELVRKVIMSAADRKRYLTDPDSYLSQQGVVPSDDLKKLLSESAQSLENEFDALGGSNPFSADTGGAPEATTMNIAAAVSAAASVVSAAAAVTAATSATKMAKG